MLEHEEQFSEHAEHRLFKVSKKYPILHPEQETLFVQILQLLGQAVHNPDPEESSLKNPDPHREVQLVVEEIK